MKKIILLIILMLTLIGCGKEGFEGTWVSKNWKETDKSIVITENGKNNYLFKFSDSKEEYSATQKKDILKVNVVFFVMDLTIDKSNNELLADGKRYIKLNKKVQKEMDEYVVKLESEIIGNWTWEEKSTDLWGKIVKDITVYNWTITPTAEKNMINIKTVIVKNKGKKDETTTVSEGIFTIDPMGRLIVKENKGKTNKFFLSKYTTVKDIKKFKKTK